MRKVLQSARIAVLESILLGQPYLSSNLTKAIGDLLSDANLDAPVFETQKNIHVALLRIAISQFLWNKTSDEKKSAEYADAIDKQLDTIKIDMERYHASTSLQTKIAYEYFSFIQAISIRNKREADAESRARLRRIDGLYKTGERMLSGLEKVLFKAKAASIFAAYARVDMNVKYTLGPEPIDKNAYKPSLAFELRTRIDEIDQDLPKYDKLGLVPIVLIKLNKVSVFAQTTCVNRSVCAAVIDESERLDQALEKLGAFDLLRINLSLRILLRTQLAKMNSNSKYLCETFELAERAIAVPNILSAFDDYKTIVLVFNERFTFARLHECADGLQRKFGKPLLDFDQIMVDFPSDKWKR